MTDINVGYHHIHRLNLACLLPLLHTTTLQLLGCARL